MGTDNIEIIRLPQKRWKDYKNLRLEALKKDPGAFGSSASKEQSYEDSAWKDRIKKSDWKRGWTIFAQSDEKLIGMLCAFVKQRNTVWIYGMYVSRKFRGRRIGEKLLDNILSQIKKNSSVKKIKLHVNKEQKTAVELYKKTGFKITKEEDSVFGDGKSHKNYVMEKTLE